MTDRSRSSRRRVLVGLAAAPLALPNLVRGARAQTAAPIVIRVAGPVTALDIPASYYSTVPQALFWKQEGLDVRMNGFNGANNAAIGMAAGQADVAFSASSALLTLRATHPEIEAAAFYTMITAFQSMPYVLMDSPIKTAADLAGKVIGVESLANSQVQTTQAIVKIAGKDPTSLQFRAVGVGPEAAYALSTKRIDALALYDGLYAGLANLGVAMRPVESSAINPERVGFISTLYALRSTLQTKADAMTRLGRGVAKASLFTQTNPEPAVRIHWAAFPATKAQGVSEDEAMRRSLLILRACLC